MRIQNQSNGITPTISMLGNLFEYAGVFFILLMTIGLQLILKELPCPLCLLQRLGMIGILFGFLLNFRFGYYPSHYAIVLFSALFTAFVALRQIALHVISGTGAYGSAIFGLHLYTWSFIVAMLIVISTTLLLSFDRQYVSTSNSSSTKYLTNFLFALTFTMIAANIVSVVLECGFQACPDNPVKYEMLSNQ